MRVDKASLWVFVREALTSDVSYYVERLALRDFFHTCLRPVTGDFVVSYQEYVTIRTFLSSPRFDDDNSFLAFEVALVVIGNRLLD